MIKTEALPAKFLAEKYSNNEDVCRRIARKVARNLFSATDEDPIVEIGPLLSHYYSFTFSLKVRTLNGLRDVFVKIPKADLRGRVSALLPISTEDRTMAAEEIASLKLLGQKWNGDDLEVRWVNIYGFIREYNAIITNRIFAEEALSVFRRLDLRRRFGFRKDAIRLRHSMSRLGTALGRFHRDNAKPRIFRLSETMPKFDFYCRALSNLTTNVLPKQIFEILQSIGNIEIEGVAVPTLKGIDIRNLMIDGEGRLFFLDPGKMKFTYREADLSRFLMTYRILYWGSMLFPFFREPDLVAESAFLESYFSGSQVPCSRLLSLSLLKEQLKHWHTGLDSLERLNWPARTKRLVAAIYVNPFYTRQVSEQLRLIGKNK